MVDYHMDSTSDLPSSYPPPIAAISPDVLVLLGQINQATSVEELLNVMSRFPLNDDCEIIALRRCVFDVEENPSLFPQASWSKSTSHIKPWIDEIHVQNDPLITLWILSGGPPIFIEGKEEEHDDIELTSGHYHFLRQQGIVSLYHVLIQSHGTPIAVLSVKWGKPRSFSDDEKTNIEFVCSLLAPALETFYLREQVQKLEKNIRDLEQDLSETGTALHAIAHDLKQPLASILTSASLLDLHLDKLNTDRIKDKVQSITSVGTRMNNWINSILLLAQVRSDEGNNFHKLRARDSLESALAELEDVFRHLSPVIEIDTSLDNLPLLWGNSIWVEHIWSNLLSNACKYGGIPPHISIDAIVNADSVRFSVRDNGSGVPQDKLDDIFEAFVRLDTPDRKRVGTGIGLTIIRQLVEKQQGEVGVESDAEGTTFWFSLPIAP